MPDYTQSSENKMSEHNFLQNEESEEDQSSEDKVYEDSFYQREDSDEGQLLKDKVSEDIFLQNEDIAEGQFSEEEVSEDNFDHCSEEVEPILVQEASGLTEKLKEAITTTFPQADDLNISETDEEAVHINQYANYVPHGSVLPPEVIQLICSHTLAQDGSMLHNLNRVSPAFKDLLLPICPQIHISESVMKVNSGITHVSIRKLLREAGTGSGLALRLKQLFGQNPRWARGWLILKALLFSRFAILDLYWTGSDQ